MKKFIWTNEYSLGIGIIDEQHQHFFEIANQIYSKLEEEKNKRVDIVIIINELKDYAFYHLATEEKYFNQFAYSDMDEHMNQHAMFRQKSDEYLTRVENQNEDIEKLALEVADFATNWLSDHIVVSDRLYAPLFKEHGLN